MKEKLKRVLAINDISCIGRCSLTVALPIISAAEIECSILPTAVLSTHTGGFTGYTFNNLSADIIPIEKHWKTLNIKIDTIYSGFLGSADQIDKVITIIEDFRTNDNIVVVDPVMADNGKLYASFDTSFPKYMRHLCSYADVIIPNITEACLMTGVEYKEGCQSKAYIEELIGACLKIGAKEVVLTGVSLKEGKLGIACYDSKASEVMYYDRDYINGYFHGTGDVFGSTFVSALTKGKDLFTSSKLAVDITVEAIEETINRIDTDIRYGVNFEVALKDLNKALK